MSKFYVPKHETFYFNARSCSVLLESTRTNLHLIICRSSSERSDLVHMTEKNKGKVYFSEFINPMGIKASTIQFH